MSFRGVCLFSTILVGVAGVTLPRPLSCHEVHQIVDRHNLYRLAAAQKWIRNQPKASNMHVLMWDEALASKARHYAEGGVFGHNPDRNDVLERFRTGENIDRKMITLLDQSVDVTRAVDAWASSLVNYSFTPIEDDELSKYVGTYTQIVWAKTTLIGCGLSVTYNDADDWYYLLVCNYGPSGNVLNEFPYDTGEGCERLCCALPDCSRMYGAC